MDTEETAALTSLLKSAEGLSNTYNTLLAYYEGAQRLDQLGLAIPPELRRFIVIVNWPRLGIDALEERLDIEGFRYPGQSATSDELWRVWQANNLDEGSQLGHLDAFTFGRSYGCVGTNEDDKQTPIVTVESPLEMFAKVDPRSRKVTGAVRRTVDENGQVTAATLYLPNATLWLSNENGQWVENDRDDHKLGRVPVVPLVNRPRTGNPLGSSEMSDVIPLTDAACRALTNLQIAQETHAVPQRGVLGATQGDFVDADGQPLAAWQAYFGTVWALDNENAKTFQFDPSDLSNFETVVNLYARLVASVTGLPPHYLGFTTENPASADAIRSSEARLVKRAERKQRPFGGAWEELMRLVRRFQTGDEDENARRLETVWRDPSTPTVAQKADAAFKLYNDGKGPVTLRQTREDLGYSEEQIKRMEADDAANDPTVVSAQARLALARQIDGNLPSNTALAAAGLFAAATATDTPSA